MKNKFGDIAHRISFMFLSNLIGFVVSSLVILVVPKYISVEHYGYFQLYIFYVGFVGFANLGWPEGILLRYGGEKYDNLDKAGLKSQFILYSMLSSVIGAAFCIYAIAFSNADKLAVWIGVGICIIVFLPRAFLQVLLHMTNRTNEYAKGIIVEKIVYFVAVFSILLLGIRDYYWLIIAELLGKTVAMLYVFQVSSELFHTKRTLFKTEFPEIFLNISIGIKLMLANLASLFIIGIVRQCIEWHWDVATFGKISLTLSVSNLLMVFIRAVAIVLFPTLKKTASEKLPILYRFIRLGLMIMLYFLLLFQFPMKAILSMWLPKYAESLRYIVLLFPLCIFESKMSMLVEPYMKTLRMEKQLLLINIISVALSLCLAGITVFIIGNLELAVLSILVLVAFRCIFAEILLAPKLGISVIRDIVLELLVVISFIGFNWIIGGILGLLLYLAVFLIYLSTKTKDIKSVYGYFLSK